MKTIDILPNGKPFAHWEDTTKYVRELHVRAGAPDGGDGSQEHPFNTIQAAADHSAPATKIIIHEGIYRECVRPLVGGSGADGMILYEGGEGENAVVTGTEIYTGTYSPSEGWKRSQFMDTSNRFADPGAKLYAMRLPRRCFDGSNPFGMTNGGLTPWFFRDFAKMFHTKELEQQKIVVQKRGMIFCDGKRLKQVSNYYEMGKFAGSYYVEDDGINIHIRLFDDGDPAEHEIEFTAREQCFAPDEKYLGYIRLKNLTFEKAGTGFPPPQRGAVSVQCGNHWMIDDCTVREVNGVGMDIGFQAPARMSNAPRGHMYVRNCTFINCGFSGLVGTCGQTETEDYIEVRQEGFYVADNTFIGCCWQNDEQSMEEAALKLHHTKDSMVLRNRMSDTIFGQSMWLDASHMNLAVRGNIMTDAISQYALFFLENSRNELEVSRNIFAGCKKHIAPAGSNTEDRGGAGFKTTGAEDLRIHKNLFLGCEGPGIEFNDGAAQRMTDGRGCTYRGVDILENIFSDCEIAFTQVLLENHAEGNLYGRFAKTDYIRVSRAQLFINLPCWQKQFKKDLEGKRVLFDWSFNEDHTAIVITKNEEQRILDLSGKAEEQIDALYDWLKA